MPNLKPLKQPTAVFARVFSSADSWELAVLHERRWIDEATGRWEGRVTFGTARTCNYWVPFCRLRLVDADWGDELLPLGQFEVTQR